MEMLCLVLTEIILGEIRLKYFHLQLLKLQRQTLSLSGLPVAGNVRFKYVFFRGNGIVSKYNSGTSTIVGQANAAGAMAVGAVLFRNTPAYGINPPTIASFSSTGGTPVNDIIRNKPEFTAPNGVNTTVYLGGQNIDGDAFPNFLWNFLRCPACSRCCRFINGRKEKIYQPNNYSG